MLVGSKSSINFNSIKGVKPKMIAISEVSNDESRTNSKYNRSAREYDSRRVSVAPEID